MELQLVFNLVFIVLLLVVIGLSFSYRRLWREITQINPDQPPPEELFEQQMQDIAGNEQIQTLLAQSMLNAIVGLMSVEENAQEIAQFFGETFAAALEGALPKLFETAGVPMMTPEEQAKQLEEAEAIVGDIASVALDQLGLPFQFLLDHKSGDDPEAKSLREKFNANPSLGVLALQFAKNKGILAAIENLVGDLIGTKGSVGASFSSPTSPSLTKTKNKPKW